MKIIKLLFFFLVISSYQLANATIYYVSPTGVNTNSGTAINSPWPLKYTIDRTNPSDSVFLLSGNYDIGTGISITRSGNPTNYISYKKAPSNFPVFKASNPCLAWNALNILASYIVIDGIELIGNNANILLADAEANYNENIAGGTNWAKYGQTNTNGICVGNHATIVPHHVIIRNCKVHDFAGGGLALIKTDFLTIQNNIVYNNAWYAMYACSGISLFHSQNTEVSYNGFTNYIQNNIVYNNKALVKWVATKTYSDGNGIIVDDNKNTQISGTPYNGSTLVENNVSYLNGASGVYVMSSQHVTLRNNTSYWNSTETANGTGNGELVCLDNNDITWVNNIAWVNPAYSATDVYAIDDDGAWGSGNTNITWKNNLTFTGIDGQSGVRRNKTTTPALDASNKLGVNPKFIDPTNANFQLQIISPAINAGTSTYGFSSLDLAGMNRIQGSSIDMGAYEKAISTMLNTLKEENKLFSVYPNPANDYILFDGIKSDFQIILYDLMGKKVFSLIVTENRLNISELTKGIYVYYVLNNDKIIYIGKVIKK